MLPYALFLLFARSMYALGDSRTPALVAIACGVVGVAAVAIGAHITDGAGRVAAIGVGNSVAYGLGAVVLGRMLSRRVHHGLIGAHAISPLVCSAIIGGAVWLSLRLAAPTGRFASAVAVTIAGAAGGAAYVAMVRAAGVKVTLRVSPKGAA